ncbi:MAG: pre-peptidase C-terminal domain-containing protein [Verrucomicrobia bacterium]|nr:pre-peptidase C-terminal domain-containing protein [Verrucomicrobiota bacterium]
MPPLRGLGLTGRRSYKYAAPTELDSDRKLRRASLAMICLSLAVAVVARAQPVPKISSVAPEWVQRGTTAELVFSGNNLKNATAIFFSSGDARKTRNAIKVSDIVATDNDKVTARVTVATNAPLGQIEVRVVTLFGVSEPLSFGVSDLVEVVEKPPNNSPDQAQSVGLPAAINGVISAASEVDYFRFHAKKGEQLIFDVHAMRDGSSLDSSLAVLDDAGKELARNEDANGFDSLIEFSAPRAGEYLLQLRDFRYQGGKDFKYRIHAGTIPYLESIFPFGGQRSHAVEIALKGRNLGDATRLTRKIASNAPLGGAEIRAQTESGLSNPRDFIVDDLPELTETEPNDTTNQANLVSVPLVVNGRIGKPKDVDLFTFKSDNARRLICSVAAERFGSPLDALLTLTDASGKVLQQKNGDDGEEARIDYDKFATNQEYTISIRDLNERGGEEFAYRLSIRPPAPDFSVEFFPDALRVTRGGHVPVRCEVTRQGGFTGAVRFAFRNLPTGVFCEPVVLAENTSSGSMTISAAPNAAPGSSPIKLVATAFIGGKLATHTANAVIVDQPSTKKRRANSQTKDRPVEEAFVTVLEAPPFVVDPITSVVAVDQGQAATIDVAVQRKNGFTNDIELTVVGFLAARDPISKSVGVVTETLRSDRQRANLKLNVNVDAETGTRPINIKATAKVDDQTLTDYSRAIPLTINQIPFALVSSLPRLSVVALPPEKKSAAGEAVFSVRANRRSGFSNEIALAIEGLPEGVVARYDKIQTNEPEANVSITATNKELVGKEISFTVLGTAMFHDRIYKHRTGEIKLIVTAPPEETADAVGK